MGREVVPDGRDLATAKKEGAVGHVVERHESALGVGDLVVLTVDAGDARRSAGVEQLPAPHGDNARGSSASCHLSHCVHELNQPRGVAHRVVQPRC